MNKIKKIKDSANPFKVSDILYASWGYGQTNIDFYQVVRVSPKSIWVKEIKGVHVDGSGNRGLSAKIRPIMDDFKDDIVQRKTVQWFRGEPNISSKYGGSLYLYNKGKEGVFYSWGH